MKRIFYAGDSTAQINKIDTYPQTGMAQALALYTKEDVEIKSFAKNGRSTKSFIDEGRLAMIESEIGKGDILFIQFGHNDAKAEDPARFADAKTDYKVNLKKFIDAAKKAEAIPVLISPIARRYFDEEGNFLYGHHGEYPNAMREVAAKEGVDTVDLTTLSENFLANMGELLSRDLFIWPTDNTHLKPQGAMAMCELLVGELKKKDGVYTSFFI